MSISISYIIINFVLCFTLYKLGWKNKEKQMAKVISDDPDNMIAFCRMIKQMQEQEDHEENGGAIIEVTVEKLSNQYYVYDKVTNNFLGQGSTIESAMEVVTTRFAGTGKTFTIADSDVGDDTGTGTGTVYATDSR